MPEILDGKKARDSYKKALNEASQALLVRPTLALIQIGTNAESDMYIAQKKKFAEDVGATIEHIRFSEDASALEIQTIIRSLNSDTRIHGIIVQLPIPKHLDVATIIDIINPLKDVDGLTSENQQLLAAGTPRFIPATAKGVMDLLAFYSIDVYNKRAVVFGRSRLVGSPIADLLRSQGAQVSIIHSQTPDPKTISKQADIVVVAIGKAGLIDASYLQNDAIVIDVGINSVNGRLTGDVDHESVASLVKAISPVPGGVGPMTVLSLFANLILSAQKAAVK